MTLLAMLGLTMAGAGVMKSQTAIAKQKEQATQKAQALAELKTLQSAQQAQANANWVQNQTMQASAKQSVFTPVTESRAYKDFQSDLISWAQRVKIAEMLVELDGTIFDVSNEPNDNVKLAVFRIKQAWDRAIEEGLMSRDTLLSYEQDLAQCFLDGVVNISNLQSLMTNIYEYNINVSQNMSDDETKIALSRLFASSLHITAYLDEISVGIEQSKSGLDTFNQYFTKTIVGEDVYPVTIYLGSHIPTKSYQGVVPLHQSNELVDDLTSIYLGSDVSVATITHEFFHQLDRYWGEELISGGSELSYFSYLLQQRNYIGGLGLPTTDTRYLIGRASDIDLSAEIWADNGMTAVLNGQQINLSEDESWSENALVGWSNTRNALLVANAFKEYIFNLLQMGE